MPLPYLTLSKNSYAKLNSKRWQNICYIHSLIGEDNARQHKFENIAGLLVSSFPIVGSFLI